MIRFLAIFIGAGVLGVFVLIKVLGGNDGPAYVPVAIKLAPKEVNTTIAEQREIRKSAILREVKSRFGDAPDDVIELAAKIADPEVSLNTYSGDILSLSSEDANRGYGQPFPNAAPKYVHTLLREAVVSDNPGAAALLLDRGASVNYNDDEMAFQAVNLETSSGKYDYWFPDYSDGSKFLRMWLDRGGDPNITHPLYGDSIGTLINHTPKTNLESTITLLDFGADPWSPFAVYSEDGGFLYELPGYFVSLATGDRQSAEISFRLARMGYYDNGPSDQVDALRDAMEQTASRFTKPDTLDSMNTAWALQKAYDEVFKSLDTTPGPNARELQALQFPADVGGFFLAPGEIRSAHRSDQQVFDRAHQVGKELWP